MSPRIRIAPSRSDVTVSTGDATTIARIVDTSDDPTVTPDSYLRAAWICAALGCGYFFVIWAVLGLTVGMSALIRPQNGFFYVIVVSPAVLLAAAGAVCWRQSLTAGLGPLVVSLLLIAVVTVRYWLG
jgi:hypothetical protein